MRYGVKDLRTRKYTFLTYLVGQSSNNAFSSCSDPWKPFLHSFPHLTIVKIAVGAFQFLGLVGATPWKSRPQFGMMCWLTCRSEAQSRFEDQVYLCTTIRTNCTSDAWLFIVTDANFWVFEDTVEAGLMSTEELGLRRVFLGREVAWGRRDWVSRYSGSLFICISHIPDTMFADLKQRSYLGPTSMDNELALIMANQVREVAPLSKKEERNIHSTPSCY